MPNIRPISIKKYNISRNRFYELYYKCLQYGEWKDELKYKTDTLKTIEVSDMPICHSESDVTQQLAIHRIELERKCKVIEDTALEAGKEVGTYILKAVTDEKVTYQYLKTIMGIPCSHNTYYDRRRKFYWLLSKKKI